jgi:hypothetical protein
MSSTLCPAIAPSFAEASKYSRFFEAGERKRVEAFEPRERPLFAHPADACKTNLFFGFFFDGTKNNYVLAENGKNHSNVARLYDCYPGLSVPGVLPAYTDWQYKPANYSHFFKVYIPGVASPFKEINDSGEGLELTRGAAMGYRGEARIVWTLIQAINNLHRYFLKAPLVSPSETASLISQIDLSAQSRRAMGPDPLFGSNASSKRTRQHFEKILRRLHGAISQHWPDKSTGRPKKIDPGMVQTIHVSIFGFSRGATQARAFANWLIELCKLDARLSGRGDAMTLGAFKLELDFMGLFDTVASVGAGNTFGSSRLGKMFDGHDAWADAEGALRIPDGVRCVHLVAAHEVRRSFPLDSIAVGLAMPNNCEEVVFPGVHSDLGCGYCPCEQGRGVDPDGADMLARVPLVYMYKLARLAGVPLKLELASEVARRRFAITPATIVALNTFLGVAVNKFGPLRIIMREQAKLQIQWRLARRVGGSVPLESSQSFARATAFDQNDLHSANLEFEKEIAAFEAWLAAKGQGFVPKAQSPGFDNEYENEWEEIATWWNKGLPPSQAVLSFFDEYVHDSRAWFKLIPGNPDNEADMHAQLKKWVATRQRVKELNAREEKRFIENQNMMARLAGRRSGVNTAKYKPQLDGLTNGQRDATDEYARTNKIPRMLTEGREPFEWGGVAGRAGYLRYRKVYGGGDSTLIAKEGEDKLESRRVA